MMGDNNLNPRSNTQIVQAADVNQYRTALNETVVPRNSSGVATDVAGGLGSSLLRWATSYIRDIYIGAFSSTLRIREGSGGDAGKLLLEAGAATRPVKIEATGLDGTTIKDATTPSSALVTTARRMKLLATITASGDYVVPAGITAIMPEVWAGGGGGGGTTSTGGGAGGGSSRSIDLWVPVTPGETLTATIGAGGAGGGGGLGGSPGLESRLARSGATIAYANGGEAGGGNVGSADVAGTSNGISNYVYRFGGGLGGAVGDNGGVGTVSIPSGSSGGTGGVSVGGGSPAGGGGGGAGYLSGANGGNGNVAGSSAAANSGAGGGGAGGRNTGPILSGGSGGSGIILIWAVE